ncbi:hypothetical protein GCM10023238_35050 [Streptomyces heliomycini]
MAYRRPSSPKRIQAMSSPIVSTVQPEIVGSSMARLVLPQADGKAAGDVLRLTGGRGELEDEHVLGEPALVAGHDGGDAQGVALLAEQGVAAVAGAVGPDLAVLGEVRDVLGPVAGPGDVLLAGFQRGAHRVHGLDEEAVGAELVQDRRPIRVMVRMETATYAESVISTPMADSGEPRGPMQKGTTYMVRPFIEPRKTPCSPRKVSRISAGAFQWLVGPASSSFSEQMKVRSSTRATSVGSEAA